MRRRKKKGSDILLLSYEDLVFKDPLSNKGNWHKVFNNDNPIHLEVGTGRGKFITTLAKENKNINYIAMEIKEEVLLKAVQKCDENESNNIRFIWGNVDNILEYFDENEIDSLFINFCDPWPKKRWSHRRLTHNKFLEMYKKVLKDNGEIHFKTDNENLFEFSLNEFSDFGFKLKNITLNLIESDYIGNITTEYEEKFMAEGIKIFRVEAIKS